MANIDLGNLTRYDGKIKEYTEDKYLSKNTANWQMTEKAGAVTCYPVPDTDLEPIVDFSFKEVPPANGEKSPSNPSTIEGVNSAKVMRCGKNLVPTPYRDGPSFTLHGYTPTENSDGSITWNGTTDNVASCHLVLTQYYSYKLCSGITYTASLTGYVNSGLIFQAYTQSGNIIFSVTSGGNVKTFTLKEDTYVTLRVSASTTAGTLVNAVVYPQLELGTTATSFEPYNGADCIIDFEDTYYGGKVNLATGLMTLTWVGFILTSAYTSDGIVNNTDLVQFLLNPETTYKHKAIENTDVVCNRFIPGQTFISTSFESARYYCRIPKNLLDVSEAVDPDNPTNSEWLQAGNVWFNENPVHFAYKIVTPYIVQLTPIQIKSLFVLDKNTPRLNTLYTDADSIQVGYQKHPARTSYELENAILALGGGE